MRRLALLVVVLLLAAGSPAYADGPLGLSHDGVRWSDSLSRPLFDPALRWVPGDVRTARFYVRNQVADDGDLTVAVARTAREDLVETGFLRIAARSGGAGFTEVADGGSHTLLDADDLAAGAEVAVDVRVAMSPDAPNGTMVLGTDLDFTVTLTDARAVSDAGSGDGSGDDSGDGEGDAGGVLPDTGTGLPPWATPLALLLLLCGGALVTARRRDPEPVTTDVSQEES